MPEMDSYEATRAIRLFEDGSAQGAGARQIIIAPTANVITGDKEACLAAGMDDYLSKPFTLERLAHMLDKWGAKPRSTSEEDADAVVGAD